MGATRQSLAAVASWGSYGGLTGRLFAASGLLFALVATAFGVLALAINDLRESANVVLAGREQLVAADEVHKLVNDLETALGGFIITQDDQFLAPWNDASAALPSRTEALERLAVDSPAQSRRAHSIGVGVSSYIDDYGLPLIDAAKLGDDSVRSFTVTEEGTRRIDALRAQLETFRATERALLSARQDQADMAAQRAVTAAWVGLASSLALVAIFTGYLSRAIVQPVRRAATMARRLAGGNLSARMPATSIAELGTLEETFNEMAGSLERNRDELAELASEQAALRRVATLVAQRAEPEDVFSAVASELAQRLDADVTNLLRFEPDGAATVVGGWSVPGVQIPVGTKFSLDGTCLAASIQRTGAPAPVDHFGGPPGSVSACFAEQGIRSGIGSPIVVEGALWGAAIVGFIDPEAYSDGGDGRVSAFTELVGTAIANAESRAELAASRARIVAAADETRRRIERDLHDGAQQRLVTLGLRIQAAAAEVPTESQAQEELKQVGAELDEVLADLRELSRGIHPAILSEGGLGPALRTLARRSAVPVQLDINVAGNLPEPVEVAVYYIAAEALTNIDKHADASVADVAAVANDGVLRLAIRDDGVGGADPAHGSGLIGLKDRVAATGGTMTVESHRGRGTSILVEFPIRRR